ARRAHVNPGYLSQIEHGTRTPSATVLRALSDVLGVDLRLPVAVAVEPVHVDLNPDAPRLLAGVLAGQRRLEDSIGARPLVTTVDTQAQLVGGLAAEARGPLRTEVLDVASQWAQFAGWLHTATGDYAGAHRWFDRAMALATETGDRDMIATALSFKGHIAHLTGKPGAVVGLSRAAAREGDYIGQRAYDAFQEAKGHAMLGDRRAAANLLATAVDLAEQSDAYTGLVPPWQYYRSPGFWLLESADVHRLLGQTLRAGDLIAQGLATLPEDQRDSEWAQSYRRDLDAATR
ncbi:MAG TPA: helix-turn-helix transcriptional regulator, partial [Cryptosporangiaceae bacterium]|nr:helix-turn-helix transcriptional regulator [Cryptosporangiaceae bacterium]